LEDIANLTDEEYVEEDEAEIEDTKDDAPDLLVPFIKS